MSTSGLNINLEAGEETQEVNFAKKPEDRICPHYDYLAEIASVFFGYSDEEFRNVKIFCGKFYVKEYYEYNPIEKPDCMCLRLKQALSHLVYRIQYLAKLENASLDYDSLRLTVDSRKVDTDSLNFPELLAFLTLVEKLKADYPECKDFLSLAGKVKEKSEELAERLLSNFSVRKEECPIAPV